MLKRTDSRTAMNRSPIGTRLRKLKSMGSSRSLVVSLLRENRSQSRAVQVTEEQVRFSAVILLRPDNRRRMRFNIFYGCDLARGRFIHGNGLQRIHCQCFTRLRLGSHQRCRSSPHPLLAQGFVTNTLLSGDTRTVTFANGFVVREQIVTIK